MPTEKWSSSLGFIEDKLRRSLTWGAGVFGLILKPELQPVILADNARRPGANEFRNRRWVAQFHVEDADISLTGMYVGLKAKSRTGIIVDDVWLSPGGGTHWIFRAYAKGGTMPVPQITDFAAWREAPLGPSDFAPVVVESAVDNSSAAGAIPQGIILQESSSGLYNGPFHFRPKAFVPQDGMWTVSVDPNAELVEFGASMILQGRVF